VRFQPVPLILAILLMVFIFTSFDQPAIAGGDGPRASMGELLAQAIPPGQFPPPFPTQNRPGPTDEARERMRREMEKKANQERQAQIKRDTAQLLKLAKELQQYVDRTNEDVLSVDVVRKAGEIEKLAHSVKEKMKND